MDRIKCFLCGRQKRIWIVQFTLKWHIIHDNSMQFLSPRNWATASDTYKCRVQNMLRKVLRLGIIKFHTEKDFFSSQQNHKELVKILQRCTFSIWWQWRAWISPDHFKDCQRDMLIWSFCPSFHLFKKSVHWQGNSSLSKWPLYCSYKYCPINRKSPCTS